MRLALYQPEIAQNVGTLMRLGACWDLPIDVIEPCGFPWDSQKMRRSGMDYIAFAQVERHRSYEDFRAKHPERIVLLDVKGTQSFCDFTYEPTDIIMVGRESCGVPDYVFQDCIPVRIPMRPQMRSLNVAISAAIGLTEALRQTRAFPPDTHI